MYGPSLFIYARPPGPAQGTSGGVKSRRVLLWGGSIHATNDLSGSFNCGNFNLLNADGVFGRDRCSSKHSRGNRIRYERSRTVCDLPSFGLVGRRMSWKTTAAVVSEKVATFAKAPLAESNAFTNGLGWSRQEKFHIPNFVISD